MTSDALTDHGPCTTTGTTVRSVVEAMGRDQILPPDLAEYIGERLDFGEREYGAPLCTGWLKGQIALKQEIADAIAYAISIGRHDLVEDLAKIWSKL
jgi:hypothetical protein